MNEDEGQSLLILIPNLEQEEIKDYVKDIEKNNPNWKCCILSNKVQSLSDLVEDLTITDPEIFGLKF